MTSGGARSRSGPAPDPNSLKTMKSQAAGAWLTLPAEGRTGEAPPFPSPNMTQREGELWESMWRKPQAIIWERDCLVELVSIFVRQLAEAEVEKASAENRKTVKGLFADLYLTSDSLARAHIRIAPPVAVTTAGEDSTAPAAPQSARSRLQVVQGGA